MNKLHIPTSQLHNSFNTSSIPMNFDKITTHPKFNNKLQLTFPSKFPYPNKSHSLNPTTWNNNFNISNSKTMEKPQASSLTPKFFIISQCALLVYLSILISYNQTKFLA